jgi:hypothetical protein
MTFERSRAYARVRRTVDDIGPAKLHDLEQRRVRNAADELLFARSADCSVLDALEDVKQLTQHLVSCGRWSPERANRLADDVIACGPDWLNRILLEDAA